MAKKRSQDREKVLSKADIKAENIIKAIEAYKAEGSELSMRQAADLYHYSHSSISNHLNKKKEVMYLPNLGVEFQKLIPVEEAALKDHIHKYAESGLPITPRLLRDLANELCKAKRDYKPVGKNWHLDFYNRHTSVESKYAISMKKARLANEDADIFIT
jgi:hypothetical protein